LLVRATTKSYNKIIPDVILGLKQNRLKPDSYLENFFKNQTADSSYWPDDTELKEQLSDRQIYKNLSGFEKVHQNNQLNYFHKIITSLYVIFINK
jgi:hypothetical protein